LNERKLPYEMVCHRRKNNENPVLTLKKNNGCEKMKICNKCKSKEDGSIETEMNKIIIPAVGEYEKEEKIYLCQKCFFDSYEFMTGKDYIKALSSR